MDTSKHFFQLHGVNAAEKVVLRKKLRRKEMVAFFKALAPTVIGIEACGASHHWARIAPAAARVLLSLIWGITTGCLSYAPKGKLLAGVCLIIIGTEG
jgi:fructoselysine-6-P-deglycase FrlB-like protein